MNVKPSIKPLSRATLLLFLIQSLSTQAAPRWLSTPIEHTSYGISIISINSNEVITHHHLPTSFTVSLERLKTILDQITFSFAHSENPRTNRVEMVKSNTDNKFTFVKNDIRKLQQQLSQFTQNEIFTVEDRARMAALQTSMKNILSVLDLQKDLLNKELDKNYDTVEQLIRSLHDFRSELNNINDKFAKQELEEVMKRMPDECVEDIQSLRFDSATQKLLLLDDSDIDYIAKMVYNHQESNFDLLLGFAQAVPNNEKAFLLYKALYYEMDTTGHKDLFKLIQIGQNLKNQFINQPMVSAKVKSKAQLLFDTLNETIEPMAVQIIADGFLNDRMSSVCQLKKNLRQISFDYMKNIFDKGMDNGWIRMPNKDTHSTLQRFMDELETLYDETTC